MKEWWKIAGCVILIALLATDIGLQVVDRFAPPLIAATQQERSYREPRDSTASPNNTFDYTSSIVGFLTIVVLIYQSVIFKRQARIGRSQAQIAAQQSRIAMKQANLTAAQIADAKAIQRANMVGGATAWSSAVDRDRTIVVWGLTIAKNTGQTPAKRISFWRNHGAFSGDLPDEFDFPPPAFPPDKCGLVGPGDQFSSTAVLIEPNVIKGMAQGRLRFHMGQVRIRRHLPRLSASLDDFLCRGENSY